MSYKHLLPATVCRCEALGFQQINSLCCRLKVAGTEGCRVKGAPAESVLTQLQISLSALFVACQGFSDSALEG